MLHYSIMYARTDSLLFSIIVLFLLFVVFQPNHSQCGVRRARRSWEEEDDWGNDRDEDVDLMLEVLLYIIVHVHYTPTFTCTSMYLGN